MSKVVSLDTLNLALKYHRQDGAKIIVTGGCFDPLHIGHVHHLKAARKLGNVLVVLVTGDRYVNKGIGRPKFNEQDRSDMLAELECVDYVVINQDFNAEQAILLGRLGRWKSPASQLPLGKQKLLELGRALAMETRTHPFRRAGLGLNACRGRTTQRKNSSVQRGRDDLLHR